MRGEKGESTEQQIPGLSCWGEELWEVLAHPEAGQARWAGQGQIPWQLMDAAQPLLQLCPSALSLHTALLELHDEFTFILSQDFVLRTNPCTLAIFTPRLLDLVKPDHLTPELSK